MRCGEVVVGLLTKGVNIKARNKHERIPLAVAETRNYKQIV